VSRKNVGAQYGRALSVLEQAERKMTRAFNAWVKARARLKSLDKKLTTIQQEIDNMENGK